MTTSCHVARLMGRFHRFLTLSLSIAISAATFPLCAQTPAPRSDYSAVADRITSLIDREMRAQGLPDPRNRAHRRPGGRLDAWLRRRGLRIAASGRSANGLSRGLDLQAVHRRRHHAARGAGQGRPRRAGASRYIPEFHPNNPYDRPITLRQLMSHRAGLVREPPVGSYFDSTSPPLAATIASLNRTTLVYPPATHTKYSNAAIATVGYVRACYGCAIPQALSRAVLQPLGMTMSGFEPTAALTRELAPAMMWTLDGRSFPHRRSNWASRQLAACTRR